MQWNATVHKIPSIVAGLEISSFNPLNVYGKTRIGVVVYGLRTDLGLGLVLATLFPLEQ